MDTNFIQAPYKFTVHFQESYFKMAILNYVISQILHYLPILNCRVFLQMANFAKDWDSTAICYKCAIIHQNICYKHTT